MGLGLDHLPQWLHLHLRAKSKLNSLLHFLHAISARETSLCNGGGPLSNGRPRRPSDMILREFTPGFSTIRVPTNALGMIRFDWDNKEEYKGQILQSARLGVGQRQKLLD